MSPIDDDIARRLREHYRKLSDWDDRFENPHRFKIEYGWRPVSKRERLRIAQAMREHTTTADRVVG